MAMFFTSRVDLRQGFMNARAEAIEDYGELERGLASLFAGMIGTSERIGHLIFFRMVNTRSRLAVMEELVRVKTPESRAFFSSLSKLIGQCDTDRNKVIHWGVMQKATIRGNGRIDSEIVLSNTTSPPGEGGEFSVEEMDQFAEKCFFVGRNAHEFARIRFPQPTVKYTHWGDEREAWLQTFRGPITHPPSADHPLFQTLEIRKAQRQSASERP
ncbi:MAG: hypothetical protein ACRDGM_16725 [bacterium]